VTCNEWRERWLDAEPTREMNVDWHAHRVSCTDCQAWQERQELLDAAVGPALFVAPPAELSARLAALPKQIARAPALTRPTLGEPAQTSTIGQTKRASARGALDLALLVAVTLAAVSMTLLAVTFLVGWVLPWLQDLVVALPLVFNSFVVSTAENLATTAVQALATLILLGLVLLQVERSANRPLGEG